jgi:hypothetical protein
MCVQLGAGLGKGERAAFIIHLQGTKILLGPAHSFTRNKTEKKEYKMMTMSSSVATATMLTI